MHIRNFAVYVVAALASAALALVPGCGGSDVTCPYEVGQVLDETVYKTPEDVVQGCTESFGQLTDAFFSVGPTCNFTLKYECSDGLPHYCFDTISGDAAGVLHPYNEAHDATAKKVLDEIKAIYAKGGTCQQKPL